MKMRLNIRQIGWVALLLAGSPLQRAVAQGIPEPTMIIYGELRNVRSTPYIRETYGTLTWRYQPPSGAPIVLTTSVTNINDQFSFILNVPCETEVSPLPISPNTVKLTASPVSYNRAQVFWNVTNAVALEIPSTGTITLTSLDRGRIERLNLVVDLPLIDSDGNGMPDDWQRQYFGHLGVNPLLDSDGDGVNNLNEYKAGTNPKDAHSLFKFISIRPDPLGGLLVEWSSVTNRLYAVERSQTIERGFIQIATGLPATSPANSYRDATALSPSPYFYRLRLVP
jgi:hypothetical protein